MQTQALADRDFYKVVRPTTLIRSPRVNFNAGLDIVLACETFQQTGSFKFRAAYSLAANVPHKHIITASSGNFGQALAYACKLTGKRCTVVMPDNSACVKVEAVQEFGAQVEPVSTKSKSRAQRVSELAAEFPDALVASAFDDDLVIEGNASLGRELAAVTPLLDAILVPVGGGGLSAGIIKGLRAAGNRHTKVYGVEPAIANDFARSLKSGAIVAHDNEPQTIADGVRTLSVGARNWQHLKEGIAGVIEVSEEQIKDAMRRLFMLANVKAEPTGAVALAGALAFSRQLHGQSVCCVVSGGNVDPAVFHAIICEPGAGQ